MRTALLLIVAFLSSGCISALAHDVPAATDPTADPTAASPADASASAGSGTATAHGAPQRTESPVTVTLGPDGYTAAKDVTVTNDFGGAPAGKLTLATTNGPVTAQAWDQGGYRLAAHLEGKGQTEQQARDALTTLQVVSQDSLGAGLLEFGMQVKFNDPPSPLPAPTPVSLPHADTMQRSASVVASLPAAPAESLKADTTNGPITVAGLHGPGLDLGSTNGPLHVAGAWDTARLATTNGPIQLDGLFNDLGARSTNGNVAGTIESQRTCKQSIATTNGNVDLRVKDGGHGYDVKGDTTNGRVTIDVAGAHAAGKDSQHATTANFASQAVQVTLSAASTNGNVGVKSA